MPAGSIFGYPNEPAALYRRVVWLLAPEWRLALALGLANVALAGTAFVGPLLFGRIVDTLASGSPQQEIWRRTLLLLGLWACSGSAASAPACWSPCTPTVWRSAGAWPR